MEVHIPADFTLDELRAFIEGEREESVEGYYTAKEWAEHFEVPIKRMRELLTRAKLKGLLDMKRLSRPSLDEKMHQVPAYALKKKLDE
jgi:hypothetical protein